MTKRRKIIPKREERRPERGEIPKRDHKLNEPGEQAE